MKFIEVKSGVSINIESIDSFEKNASGGTSIYIKDREIETKIPYIDFVFKVAQPNNSLSAYDGVIANMDKNLNTLAKTSQML